MKQNEIVFIILSPMPMVQARPFPQNVVPIGSEILSDSSQHCHDDSGSVTIQWQCIESSSGYSLL
jgi:hypothetical protein